MAKKVDGRGIRIPTFLVPFAGSRGVARENREHFLQALFNALSIGDVRFGVRRVFEVGPNLEPIFMRYRSLI